MDFILIQFLTGLAGASSLFLVASGLSVIFGVTRIVNFAHGAFFMLGAYLAYTLTERWSGALGFWGGLVAAASAVAALGAAMEILLLRRIYAAPELFQLLATFGVTLMAEDIVLLIWGAEDLVGRRAPALAGTVSIAGQPFPAYDLVLIGLGPLTLGLIWLLIHRTRFGMLLRAATENRDLVAALGVNQAWLFTGIFALGAFLAALAGGLQLPRDAVNHGMDLRVIVEVFVVVVIGGLGSIAGAFLAAILVSELNAFGILVLPKISLVLVFLVMAAVLVVRPHGLLGKPQPAAQYAPPLRDGLWQPLRPAERMLVVLALAALVALPVLGGNYVLTIGAEVLISALFAASLQFMMSVGGLASFGHAAFFGLGAYGAALAAKAADLPLAAAIVAGTVAAGLGAVVTGWFCVRLSGVYLAMLTLAFAQILWAVAFQWVGATGGDNGILGLWPTGWAAGAAPFYWLTLALAAGGIACLRALSFSPLGYGLRAVRDAPARAEALGLDRQRLQWTAFAVAGAFAGLAGALFVFLKGSVFPDVLAIPLSIDALVIVLLGGVETVSGAAVGALIYKGLSIWLMSRTDYSRLVLGALIVGLVIALPRGVVGTLIPPLRRLAARLQLGHRG